MDGKEVTSVSYIMYNMLLPQMGMMTGNAMESAMGTLMQAHSSLNVLTANRIDVVGRNMILVNTGNINWSFMNSTMELNISPNPNLSHVKGTAIIELGKLAVLCAKQWIYNSLIIQIDQGYIRGGHSIDAIKNKIDSYESAVETYYERLENWPKIGFMLPFGPAPHSLVSLRQLYRDIYKPERYKDLWFIWKGKPCIMAYPDNLTSEKNDWLQLKKV